MDSFTQTIELDFSIPGNNIKKVKESLKKAGVFEFGIGDDLRAGKFGGMMNAFDRLKTTLGTGGGGVGMPFWLKGISGLVGAGVELTKGIFGQVKKYLPKLDDLKSETDKLVEYSHLSNENVREQALMYGFNPGQNYAFTKTREILGFGDIEDIFWAAMEGDEAYIAKFNELMTKYTEEYQNMMDQELFDKYRDVQWESAQLVTELQLKTLEFLAENKTSLMNAFDKILGFFDTILNVAETLHKWFGKDDEGNGFFDRVVNFNNKYFSGINSYDTYYVGSTQEALGISQNKYNNLLTTANMGGINGSRNSI